MKQSMFIGFSVLCFSIASPQFSAAAEIALTGKPVAIARVTPTSLVTMAYRGYLGKYGIPGYQQFSFEYALGRIDAEKLVRVAIDAQLLPTEAIHNQRYVNAVRIQLESQLPIH